MPSRNWASIWNFRLLGVHKIRRKSIVQAKDGENGGEAGAYLWSQRLVLFHQPHYPAWGRPPQTLSWTLRANRRFCNPVVHSKWTGKEKRVFPYLSSLSVPSLTPHFPGSDEQRPIRRSYMVQSSHYGSSEAQTCFVTCKISRIFSLVSITTIFSFSMLLPLSAGSGATTAFIFGEAKIDCFLLSTMVDIIWPTPWIDRRTFFAEKATTAIWMLRPVLLTMGVWWVSERQIGK